MEEKIIIRGARVHNLKNIDLDLPRNQLIVITGVSGSGKSSLAFDTIYAEGQRRYVESLSAYARQFLERMDRPDVDEIKGISPSIAIEQKNPVKTSRSTVGTATEIHDYLRLLFARIGKTICPNCGQVVQKDHVQTVVDQIKTLPAGSKMLIGCALEKDDPAELTLKLLALKEKGFFRFVVDEQIIQFEALTTDLLKSNTPIQVLIDRLVLTENVDSRLSESVELGFKEGNGRLIVKVIDGPVLYFSQKFECNWCQITFIEPEPRLFSFNNPYGACPECKGFGDVISIDLDRVIPDKSKSLNQGAITPWNTASNLEWLSLLRRAGLKYNLDFDIPFAELTDVHQRLVIEGDEDFPGLVGFFDWLETKKYKIGVRVFLSRYRGYNPCGHCQGSRLKPAALNVFIGGKNINDVNQMSIAAANAFFATLELSAFEQEIAQTILKEIRSRLKYLVDVGLGYLTLIRRTQTLSGGEMKRINLATALGSQLVGTLYILDEPTIGLHPRDTHRLMDILVQLKTIGNTVIVVEHDRETMKLADQIIDLGPGAGLNGGEVLFQGSYDQLKQNSDSVTGQYLAGQKMIPLPAFRRKSNGQFIEIIGASENNLKNLNVSFPLGCLVMVTGVSGSGKSTLIEDILYKALKREFGAWNKQVGNFQRLRGSHFIDDVILMDQSPIGRTPRSNPVTYLKIFDAIRKLFANTNLARIHGLKAGSFSFNVPGGRCETCEGAGVVKVEMQFLADLYLTCESCGGQRYKKSVLAVYYKGLNIADVLKLTVNQALNFFKDVQQVKKGLRVLADVGLGYLQLGQPATTLSGGEAQRLKLADHLFMKKHKQRLYIFDEPSTGLHFDDIQKLLKCFNQLIGAGNSVIVIEHNLDIIKCADYIIDLGPEGGDKGGTMVANGTPEQIIQNPHSSTGRYLKAYLE